MTIRETVEEKINFGLAKKWAIESHCSTLSEKVLVYPDGSLQDSEEVSDNTWSVLPGTTEPVQSLYGFYHSCGCNCDFCAEYDRYKEIIENEDDYAEEEIEEAKERLCYDEETKEFDSKHEWLEGFIADTDEVSNVMDRMTENLENIPYGYFEDEE